MTKILLYLFEIKLTLKIFFYFNIFKKKKGFLKHGSDSRWTNFSNKSI